MGTTIRKFMYIVLIIWTVIILFFVYKNINFPFVLQFVVGYVIFLILTCLYFTITIFLNVRKLKWNTIKKMLLQFIVNSFAIWALSVLLIYIAKGELRIMEKMFNSIIISFGLTFWGLIFEKENGD